jgi:nitrate/nitrite transport system ATP-binding protein
MKVMLDIWSLAKEYPGASGPAVIVEDFNLKVAAGEFVCVVGHSGCGKSTVLSILMGLSEPSRGTVILDDKELAGPGCDRGVVFQSSALLPWLNVRDNVQLAVDQVARGKTAAERRALAEKYLSLVGLDGLGEASPGDLSAGMRQRVGIARAFATEPSLLLLDEPFSLLDAITRLELQDQLAELCRRTGKTVLMVTHDVDEALLLADRIVMMTSGPAARIGEILEVPFARPRDRTAILEEAPYYQARDRILSFLESGHAPRTRPSLVYSQPARAPAATTRNVAADVAPKLDRASA